MLTREQAHERLEAWRAAKPARPGALARLRNPTAATLVQLLDPARGQDGQLVLPDTTRLAADLDALTPTRRARLFASFGPAMAETIEQWWRWSVTAPFQVRWDRRPYRSSSPATGAEARVTHLVQILRSTSSYPDRDVVWFAQWAPYVDHAWSPDLGLGPLFAAAIAAGRADVRDALVASAHGRDEVGGMGSQVVVGLLAAPDPVGWEVVEGLLVAAQRQEGLRQSVLEAVDLAHPDAFVRMLGVIIEHRLARFAATVRAVSVWTGEPLDVRQEALVLDVVTRMRGLLTAPPTPADVAGLTDPAEAFLALWSLAFRDVLAALDAAVPLLRSSDADLRHAAARFAVTTGLLRTHELLTSALADPDPRVLALAVHHYGVNEYGNVSSEVPPLDEAQVTNLLASMDRLGKVAPVGVGLLGTEERKLGASTVADVLIVCSPPQAWPRLGPAYDRASPAGRRVRVTRLAADAVANRTALLAHVGDAASAPRAQATAALLASGIRLTAAEALPIEALLTRKASDVRRACLELLRTQDADGVAASVARLSAGTAAQQDAARDLSGRPRLEPGTEEPTAATATDTGDRPSASTVQPEASTRQAATASLPGALVVDDTKRTPAVRPTAPRTPSDQAERCARLVTGLVAWLDEHKDVEVRVGNEVMMLADVRWLPRAEPDEPLPLAEVLQPWWDRVRDGLTDGGLECALVCELVNGLTEREYFRAPDWQRAATRAQIGRGSAAAAEHPLAASVLATVAGRQARPSWLPALLDAHAAVLAALPADHFTPAAVRRRREEGQVARPWLGEGDPRGHTSAGGVVVAALLERDDVAPELMARWWALSRFLDEPGGRHVRGVDPMVASPERARELGVGLDHALAQVPLRATRMLPSARLVSAAHEADVASADDVLDHVLASGAGRHASLLHRFTSRIPEPWVRDATRTGELLERVRDAALAVELARGEFATEVSELVPAIRHVPGVRWFVRYVRALGRGRLVRGYVWRGGRDSALCRVIRASGPAPGEHVEDFAAALRGSGIPERRLVEVGVYAPQWAAWIEQVIDWPGYADGVWWLHAHTKGDDWTVDTELRSEWTAQVAQRTALDATDLVRGAVDVAWFHEVVQTLGQERFTTLLSAAKYGSTSGGHKRAELFADALLGRADPDALLERIRTKRHQDPVRALGLLPLPQEQGQRDDEVLRRYEVLTGFVATDRTSGSQRRASEATAVEVALENLARTAGYADPQRLLWAMEAHAVRDLAAGPVSVTSGDLAVTLTISDAGAPELTVVRGDRELASVPRTAAKDPDVAELKNRVTTLRGQARRMRQSLERACVDGERFSRRDLLEMLGHPLLRPMLLDLVLVGDTGELGFCSPDPGILLAGDGSAVPVTSPDLRIAHPVDLLRSGAWPDLQRVLFTGQRTQPFRQLFRELYTVTEAERDAISTSHRYAGHQVQPRQSAALFRARGWVVDPDVGYTRTFHRERVTAFCSVLGTFGTPGEVEDATIETVTFHPSREWRELPLDQVPPRVFSEVMRDLDLVVSVAHSGGVDPETSASGVEVRARLVDETCDLLGLSNVETTDHHALVKGSLATYSVNLGSGVVHRQPGAAVCIIPVSAQHRGRVFLPFVDDDPRTAEVISKVVLLARDSAIKDPTILAQLR